MLLFLAGCISPAPSHVPQATGLDLGGRHVRIAVESAHPPFGFFDEVTGASVGWDYDACRAICEVINCSPDFIVASSQNLLETVAIGGYDMAADGIVITPEREEIVDFSIPYAVIRQMIVVRAGETEIVDRGSLIAGDAIVGVQIGSINEQVVVGLVGEDRVRHFDTFALPALALIAGDVAAVVADDSAAQKLMTEYPGSLELLAEPLTGEDRLAFAFPPGSALVEPVNEALRVLQENGTLDLLYERWWGR